MAVGILGLELAVAPLILGETGGHVTAADAALEAVIGPWFPAASCTVLVFSWLITVPAPVHVTETVTEVPDDAEGVKTHPVAVPVFVKLDADRPETDSVNVNVYDNDNEPVLVAVDHAALGGVVSDADTVTAIDWVPPPREVWALPAVSVIENDTAAARDDVTDPPPAVAVEVAVMVHVVELVCTMPVIAEMLVSVKSLDVSVVQSIASLPATVNEIVAEDDVAAERASVRVGGVVSAMVTLTDAGDPDTAV